MYLYIYMFSHIKKEVPRLTKTNKLRGLFDDIHIGDILGIKVLSGTSACKICNQSQDCS